MAIRCGWRARRTRNPTRSKSPNTAKAATSSSTTSRIPTRRAPTGTGSDARPRAARPISGDARPRASATSTSRPRTSTAFGENWPVDYAEIAPWFSKAERYMGVASTVQNRPSNPDGEYLPPMPWRCIDYIMQKGGEKIGVPYLPDRCAQLTVAHNGHPACHYCGNCSRGCDVGSFFSPTWFTIPDAEATKNLTLADECARAQRARRRERHGERCRLRRSRHEKEVEVYAKVVVLAASCVETAHIMLNSKSRHWPTGIANSSGQLGRNLCDHLYGISRLWISAPAPRPACDAGQHRRLHGRLDAALAESEESAGREIHPRLFGLHGRRLRGVPRLLLADRGLWHDIQARHQAVLSDASRLAHSGAVASQPHQLRRHRSREERHLRHSRSCAFISSGVRTSC